MLLSAEHISINFGMRQLVDDVSFYLSEGDRVVVKGHASLKVGDKVEVAQ